MEIHIKKIQLFILLFLTLFSTITYLLSEKKSRVIDLKKQLEKKHHHQINAALLNYKEENEIIFYNMINTPDVLSLQKAALDAKSAIQRDKYRKELYKKLKPLYTYLKHYGIKQLHFHFPDATSFLRLHKPLKYGDNLTDIRYSIVLANKNLKEVTGFEEGRIFNGYRFVYPLIYKNEHIGSLEVSIGFNAINKRIKAIYNTYQYMILNKSVVEGKLFKGEKRNYAVSLINNDFYHEANTFVNYENELQKKNSTITKNEFDKINSAIAKKITLKKLLLYKDLVCFEKVDNHYYSISFHPIKNIKKENIGYIISYEESPSYAAIIAEYYGKTIFLILLIFIVFIFFYKMEKAKEKLQIYSNKALEASKSKSEFLANMSHEIRTPLNAILGFVEILKKEEKNSKSLEYVNIIHDASYSLLKIIEDILDFSKIESGKLEIDNIDFNTRKELEIIMHLFDARCSQKDITLSLLIDSNVPNYIHSDPLRIKQVIANLLSNAIKFTDSGKKIIVKIAYKEQNLLVSVIDQGKGIAKNKQKHIFEAFNQEDTSTTRKFGGTGLGLSISSALVRLMGGKLQLKSEINEGSEFYFSIPITIGQSIDEKDFIDDEITFHGTLLLVEDNKTNQKFMQIILDDLGLEIEIANDGLEAIEMFTSKRYDLILMDENMPNMGGIEATIKILKIEEEKKLQHTPIIALTANALKGDKEKFIGAGMDEYISKPVDVDYLSEILSKYLKQKI